ncbi:hypothetical protein OG897_40110 [Streptomyces sp. NBC_00237]|uniref:hypothetical protein n=1 Tax=Streptomyces sp. NBC_00237 TaxID=2975687 RepID=UPI002252020B|nr:hypothetical protein [Streptomyces sp. NBC_00237]MCX5207597.1 hypothetical protein [Streptomyces sp. NBC_00237]
MAKPAPKVIGVLSEPAPPTWWRAHRHQVLLAAGLLVGFYLGTQGPGGQTPVSPRPGHTTPGTPTPTPHTPRPQQTIDLFT